MFTQLCKMLVLATFFPETENLGTTTDFSFIGEFLRSSADLIDLLGLAFVLSRIPGKGHNKVITAGLAWNAAEVLLSRGLNLWASRGQEFSWMYTQKCLESNILLIVHITMATLLWLFSRHDLNKKFVPFVTFLILVIAFRGVWLEGAIYALALGSWAALALKGIIATTFGFMTLYMYSSLAQTI